MQHLREDFQIVTSGNIECHAAVRVDITLPLC